MSDFNIQFEEQDQSITLEFEQIGGGAVKSVNGKTGVVVLTASDVGALPTSTPIPTVDNTLTTAGAAADAKKTGDELATVKDGLTKNIDAVNGGYKLISFDVQENTYVDRTNGTIKAYNGWDTIAFVPVVSGDTFFFNSPATSVYSAFYNANKEFLTAVTINQGNPFALTIPNDAHFLCISNERGKIPTAIYTNSEITNRIISMANAMEWENGSINSSGGNANDSISIRTDKPYYFDSDIRIVFLNTLYRLRMYEYDADGTFLRSNQWITPSDFNNNPFPIDRNHRYRVQISLVDTSGTIEQTDALSVVKLINTNYTLSFWNSYINNKVNMINRQYLTDGNDKSVFLFLTDTHWNRNPDYLNHYGINTDLMRFVAEKCNIDMVIHGGDLNSENRSDKYIAIKNMTEPVAAMRSVFDNVFLTRGNHDDNIEGSNNVWDYVITQSDSYSYMFRGTKGVVFGESGTYFYHDIPHEKLRIISIDCVDFPYSNSVDQSKSDLKILAYGYTQLQWLCDTLKNTPDGYHIVIYTHAMLAPSAVTIDHPSTSPQTRALNYLTVCDLLKAYKNRQNFYYAMDGSFVSVHKDYYTGDLNGDFTDCNASIVGVFSGHEHIDCIEEILDSNGSGTGIYNTCTQNSSNLFADTVISHTYQHPMEIGTTSELVWDVVVIDRQEKTVRMIRIGANGANTDVEEVSVRSFDY